MKNQWGWVPKTTLTKSGADTLAATREIKCLSDSHFCCLNVTLTDISTCSLRHKLMEFMSIVCNLACCLKKQETRSANLNFSTICSKVAIFYYCCTLCNKENHSRSRTLHSSSQLHWRWSTEVFNFLPSGFCPICLTMLTRRLSSPHLVVQEVVSFCKSPAKEIPQDQQCQEGIGCH
jgi:hypothetical protein